jgi:hypothetical protein
MLEDDADGQSGLPRLHVYAIDHALSTLAAQPTLISYGQPLIVVGLGVWGRFKQPRG